MEEEKQIFKIKLKLKSKNIIKSNFIKIKNKI